MPVREAGSVDLQEISGLGFLLGDKKAGLFKIELERSKDEWAIPHIISITPS